MVLIVNEEARWPPSLCLPIDSWLGLIEQAAPQNYDLAVEATRMRGLVKGYGDTHARGRDMIGRDAAFARAMINELALRYQGIVRALKNEKLRSGGERLANWILCASDKQEPNRAIELKYEKRTLASRLGMTPENLSRALAHLSEHGICSRGANIEIADRSALVRFAAPNQLLDG